MAEPSQNLGFVTQPLDRFAGLERTLDHLDSHRSTGVVLKSLEHRPHTAGSDHTLNLVLPDAAGDRSRRHCIDFFLGS